MDFDGLVNGFSWNLLDFDGFSMDFQWIVEWILMDCLMDFNNCLRDLKGNLKEF